MTTSAPEIPGVEWGVATSALPGESESGDLHVMIPFRGGLLAGAIDGLGHGAEAALVARRARAVVEAHAAEPVSRLLHRCHEELRGSRGAVMTLCAFHPDERLLTWQGVGNVEGVLLWRALDGRLESRGLVTQRGVIGGEYRVTRAITQPVGPGTLLILSTDGIDSGFADTLSVAEPAQLIADTILARHARHSDDALVLVVRFRGGP